MPNSNELISKNNASSGSKTDANLANDSNHLGGIPAEDYATQQWVKEYHGNKENTLKEELKKEITNNLDAAKTYTDDAIKAQDFSSYAEVKDLTALQKDLTAKQKECETKCKENLDKVVEDVNANFEDVGKSIESLNNSTSGLNTKYDELFQSVSSGKAKVAEAITDKGVQTSATATFDTMASNIRNISTGGGGINTIDTSDATAASYDIALGKTAYVKGSKITGTHVETGLDTSDATATPYDIKAGKTAYVNGRKIEGILDISGSNFSYNVDSVEKIYGTALDYVGEMSVLRLNIKSQDPSTRWAPGQYIVNEKGELIGGVCFEGEVLKDIKLVTFLAPAPTYNPSFFSYNKKYYSLDSDLDIPIKNPDDQSSDSYISAKISNWVNGEAYLYIYIGNDERYIPSVHVFKLKFEQEEVSEGRSQDVLVVDKTTHMSINTDKHLINANKNSHYIWVDPFNKRKLAIMYYKNYDYYPGTIYQIKDKESGTLFEDDRFGEIQEIGNIKDGQDWPIKDLKFVNEGKLILIRRKWHSTIIVFNNNNNKLSETNINDITQESASNSDFESSFLSYDGRFIYSIKLATLYEINVDYTSGAIILLNSKKLPSLISANNKYGETSLVDFFVNSDTSLLYLCEKVYDFDAALETPIFYSRTKVYSINFDTENIFDLIQIYDRFEPKYLNNDSNGICDDSPACRMLYPVKDFSKVIGLKFEGECYYKTDSTTLNALPENVEIGKRFIGRNGSPEVGTLQN